MSRRIQALAALIAFFFRQPGAEPAALPLLHTLTPLQRYYLLAYMESSRHAGAGRARPSRSFCYNAR